MDLGSTKCGFGLVNMPGCPEVFPPCEGYSWITEPVHCPDTVLRDTCSGIEDLALDLDVSPALAVMRAGQATMLGLSAVNRVPSNGDCVFNAGSSFTWVSSDDGVARLERTSIRSYTVVRAVSPGDAAIFADTVPTPRGDIRAPLAHCPTARSGDACTPTLLVLRVMR